VQRFLEQASQQSGKRVWLSREAAVLIENYDWPGNVRELQNVIARLVALRPPGPVQETDVQELLGDADAQSEDEPAELSARERQQILRVLKEVGGNKTRAAEILGIQRRTLYKKLARIEREHEGHSHAPGGHTSGDGETKE
jgi:DNA-binding NtrC family response regulator